MKIHKLVIVYDHNEVFYDHNEVFYDYKEVFPYT
jgi:hypothetical protein